MPLNISAIYPYTSAGGVMLEVWQAVSGATAGNQLVSASCAGSGYGYPKIVTAGFASATSSGKALIPTEHSPSVFTVEISVTTSIVGSFQVRDISTNEVAQSSGTSASLFLDRGTWTVTQDASKNINITCTSLGTSTSCPIFVPLVNTSSAVNVGTPPEVWQISILNQESSVLATQNVRPPLDGTLPVAKFSYSVVTVTGDYFTRIKRKTSTTAGGPSGALNDEVVLIISTTLTAGVTVTSGESSNMHSWLDNSYWYLTDLQVNLGTRAVTNRQGSIDLRPSDTINFAILFNDGSVGVDPQATDIKLAVRTSSNASAYHIWSSTTVSTVTVSGDVYYAITVTASEDDLLTAQANNLLAGSNAAQSLLGEIQWTTTRGTFSSDTFTINVPSEVVREPDV